MFLSKLGLLQKNFKNNIKPIIHNNIVPILSGCEMIIPIEILSKTSIENYYNVDFTDVLFNNVDLCNIVLLSFCVSFATYKGDRLLDAEEYFQNNIITKKEDYYNKLINNKEIIQFSLFISYISIIIIVIEYNIKEFLPLFISTFCYKYIKKNELPIKPFYISFLWTYLSCILPIMFISEIDFEEVQNYNYYLPVFLNIFATTNIADIKDYEEDLYNNINTLPTKIGLQESKYIIIISALLSNYIFIHNNNFELNLQNAFFIISNIGSLFTLYAL